MLDDTLFDMHILAGFTESHMKTNKFYLHFYLDKDLTSFLILSFF